MPPNNFSYLERPLDFLNNSKKKRVIVHLKENMEIIGELLAFDIHINLVLDNAKEIVDEKEKSIGITFIRGDTINYISLVGGK